MIKKTAILSFAVLLLTSVLARADDAHTSGMEAHKDMKMDHKGMKTKASSTIESLWQDIHKHHGELAEVIKAKKLDDVHHHAFAVRDLAKKLVAKAPAAKKAAIKAGVKNIAKLAEELDKTGDAGDQAATEANMKKFDAAINDLQAQFDVAEKK